MQKKAKNLAKGDVVVVGDEKCRIEKVEISDIGKQGTKKVRFEALTSKGEKIVLVRPEDYPFETYLK